MNCTPMTWSPSNADALGPTVIVCSIAMVIHLLFWTQLIIFPSLRQRNLMWLYAYLITDMLLLARFFIMYSIRYREVCLYPTFRTVLCYFEASSKFYMNVLESYLLLALNVCRYAQIVYNRNVYVQNPRLIILGHLCIYILPALNVMIQFLANWTLLWRRTGSSCDIQYITLSVQMFNLFVTCIIPIVLNLAVLGVSIRHVSSTRGIHSEQIIHRRRKQKKSLLARTIIFYSIWLLLWSPNLFAFQFINVNSQPGVYTSLLNYVQIAIDPIIIAALDIRFYKVWRTIWETTTGRRRAVIAPMVPAVSQH